MKRVVDYNKKQAIISIDERKKSVIFDVYK